MDNNTSTRELSAEDNINFWRGLSSSKMNNEEIFELLKKLDIEKYYKTKVMYLSSGENLAGCTDFVSSPHFGHLFFNV